jgi:hypothetical protein
MNSQPHPGTFYITIGSIGEEAPLRNEIQMVKIALLYADRAHLYSTSTPDLLLQTKLPEVHPAEYLEYLQSIGPVSPEVQKRLESSFLREAAYSLAHARRKVKEYLSEQENILQRVEILADSDLSYEEWSEIKEMLTKTTSDVKNLAEIILRGRLEIHGGTFMNRDKPENPAVP